MIYSSTWWLHNELDLARLAPYDIRAAQWSNSEPTVRHGIWQYTSDGNVNRYIGRLDCNYAYKDYPKIMRENGLNGLRKTPASSSPQKSVEELAKELIAGKWGNGGERKKRLAEADYDYDKV